MAETTKNAQHENVDQKKTGRARKVGEVVSTKMNKTIVVAVDMKVCLLRLQVTPKV